MGNNETEEHDDQHASPICHTFRRISHVGLATIYPEIERLRCLRQLQGSLKASNCRVSHSSQVYLPAQVEKTCPAYLAFHFQPSVRSDHQPQLRGFFQRSVRQQPVGHHGLRHGDLSTMFGALFFLGQQIHEIFFFGGRMYLKDQARVLDSHLASIGFNHFRAANPLHPIPRAQPGPPRASRPRAWRSPGSPHTRPHCLGLRQVDLWLVGVS